MLKIIASYYYCCRKSIALKTIADNDKPVESYVYGKYDYILMI